MRRRLGNMAVMASSASFLICLTALAQIFTPGPRSPAQLRGEDRSGAEIFATVCSQCHVDNSPTATRAPEASALRRLTAQEIKDAFYYGPMDTVGASLTDKEIDNITAFLTAPAPKPSGEAKPAS